MAFVANPYAIAGLVAWVLAWAMAGIVYFSGPARRQTRSLAMLLFLEGAGVLGGFGAIWLTTDIRSAYAWQIIGIAGSILGVGSYLFFIGTLATPLARPLRHRLVRGAIAALSIGAALWIILRPAHFAAGMIAVWWAPWEVVPGPGFQTVFAVVGFISLVALVIAFDAYRRTAPGSESRRRARMYLAAFGARDIAYGLLYFTAPLWFQRFQPASDLFVILILPAASGIFALLLGYGVLRGQLFDIDLRVRVGIQRGTLAGIFLAVFFVVATVAENYLSSTFGYLLGGAAAGLLLFAMAPLHGIAERISSVAVPSQRVTPEYLAYRKLDVYKAAVESAHETGGITDKERASLSRLRVKLALAASDADAIEADILGGAQGSKERPGMGAA